MTGVEAISNGIMAFKEPRSRNAGITLLWMITGGLLCGLYQPSEGSVMVDGVDVRQYDPAELRAAVGDDSRATLVLRFFHFRAAQVASFQVGANVGETIQIGLKSLSAAKVEESKDTPAKKKGEGTLYGALLQEASVDPSTAWDRLLTPSLMMTSCKIVLIVRS